MSKTHVVLVGEADPRERRLRRQRDRLERRDRVDRIFRGHAENRDPDVLVSGKRQRQVNSDGQERALAGDRHDRSGQRDDFALEATDGEETKVSAVGGRSNLGGGKRVN